MLRISFLSIVAVLVTIGAIMLAFGNELGIYLVILGLFATPIE